MKGVSLNVVGDDTLAHMENIHVWGEDTAIDKPHCATRNGVWFMAGLDKGKALHPKSTSALPVYKMKSAGTWKHNTEFKAVTFHDFANVELKGCKGKSRQYCMGPNTHASDHIHVQNFVNTVFDNVHDDAVAHIYEPPKGWANPTDCGNFPCTAPQNAVAKFTGTTFKGAVKPKFDYPEF